LSAINGNRASNYSESLPGCPKSSRSSRRDERPARFTNAITRDPRLLAFSSECVRPREESWTQYRCFREGTRRRCKHRIRKIGGRCSRAAIPASGMRVPQIAGPPFRINVIRGREEEEEEEECWENAVGDRERGIRRRIISDTQ